MALVVATGLIAAIGVARGAPPLAVEGDLAKLQGCWEVVYVDRRDQGEKAGRRIELEDWAILLFQEGKLIRSRAAYSLDNNYREAALRLDAGTNPKKIEIAELGGVTTGTYEWLADDLLILHLDVDYETDRRDGKVRTLVILRRRFPCR